MVHKNWFQIEWSQRAQEFSMAIKELFPAVAAVALYGIKWSGKIVCFTIDNLAVVHVVQSTYSKEPHLMRLLVFFAASFNFWFTAVHIVGKSNTHADALSRGLFLSQMPQAHHSHRGASSTSGPPVTEDNMDIHVLDQAIQKYFVAALAPSTHETHQVTEHRYIMIPFKSSAIPTFEATLCYFVACFGQQGLAHSSILTYISGVRQLQISRGYPAPAIDSMPDHQGCTNLKRKDGKPSHSRFTITPGILRHLI